MAKLPHVLLHGILLGILLLMAACAPKRSSEAPSPSPSPAVVADFVGNEACQPCHNAEFTSHQHSRHMQTLRRGTRTELGALSPPAGPIPGDGKLLWEQDQLTMVAPNKETNEPITAPVDLVLGSGKTGMTFMALDSEGSMEFRQSYFPHEKAFHVTPGHEEEEENIIGRIQPKADTAQCIGCHAVVLPSGSLMPEQKFFGVGCESCHGPGSVHVEAMKRGEKFNGQGLIALATAGGAKLNETCGRCHRTAESVMVMNDLAKQATNRFQPYGLSQSQCFKKSQDKLSCVTCHNPHQDSSTDQRTYEKTCLSCHSAPKKACPVNPKEKCVSCHMPTKPVFPGTSFPIKMADHFIKVYRK